MAILAFLFSAMLGASDDQGLPVFCHQGDILLRDGDYIGYIGLTCRNDGKSFLAEESWCENGKTITKEKEMKCPGETPHCCQSGQPGHWGAATCLSSRLWCEEYTPPLKACDEAIINAAMAMRSPEVFPVDDCPGKKGLKKNEFCSITCKADDLSIYHGKARCVDQNTVEIEDPGCSLKPNDLPILCSRGDTLFRDGDIMGQIGLTCLKDGKSFLAEESRCENGKTISEKKTMECPGVCCQSGQPGHWGAATCLRPGAQCKEFTLRNLLQGAQLI